MVLPCHRVSVRVAKIQSDSDKAGRSIVLLFKTLLRSQAPVWQIQRKDTRNFFDILEGLKEPLTFELLSF